MSQSAKHLRQDRQQYRRQSDSDRTPHPTQDHEHHDIHGTEKIEPLRRDKGLEMSVKRTSHPGKKRGYDERHYLVFGGVDAHRLRRNFVVADGEKSSSIS
jgi:hypothetical protein